MKNKKMLYIWIAAFVVTLAAAIFQRMTGPTHPFRESVTLNTKNYSIKLPRSLETGDKSNITVSVKDENVTGKVSYRVYPSKSTYSTATMVRTDKGLEFVLPEQMAAGKLEYRITLSDNEKTYESPFLVVRYKDPVPALWLIPHVLIMFLAMLFAVGALIMAIINNENYSRTLLAAGILLFIGGMVLGPIVQKYAFGEYWTGIPLGWDLTDNKTLIAMLMFIYAIYRNFKEPSRMWTIIAVAVLLIIYSIPHSMYGSERDPESGKIIQGNLINTDNSGTILQDNELLYRVKASA